MKYVQPQPSKHGVIQLSRTDHVPVQTRTRLHLQTEIELANGIAVAAGYVPDVQESQVEHASTLRKVVTSSAALSSVWLLIVFFIVGSLLLFVPSRVHRHGALHSGNDKLANALSEAYLKHGHGQLPKLITPPVMDAFMPELTLTPLQSVLPLLDCGHKTVMNVVAHQDDDLLFINPTIAHNLHAGNCVRTIYVTAGDDGRNMGYLQAREIGAERAYSTMLGISRAWQTSQLTLASGKTVVIDTPLDNQSVSLIFLRLPDGNLEGDGFPATSYQSLAKLHSGAISAINSVDHKNTYDSAELIATLGQLMDRFHPSTINTQSNDAGEAIADHSDHISTGQFTAAAAASYASREQLSVASLVHYFRGYPIRGQPENLSPVDSQEKAAAFFAYAANDNSVCQSLAQCTGINSSYAYYVSRLYGAAD